MRFNNKEFDQSDVDVWMENDITQYIVRLINEERKGYIKRLISEPTDVQAQKIKTLDHIVGLMREPNKK